MKCVLLSLQESSRLCWRSQPPASGISLPLTSHGFEPVAQATRAEAAAISAEAEQEKDAIQAWKIYVPLPLHLSRRQSASQAGIEQTSEKKIFSDVDNIGFSPSPRPLPWHLNRVDQTE